MGVGLGGTGSGFGAVVFGGFGDFSPASLGSVKLWEEKTWVIKGGVEWFWVGRGFKV